MLALVSGQENNAAGLLFHHPLEQFGLFRSQPFGPHAHVADEDDVVLGQFLHFLREFDQVPGAFSHLLQSGVE